MRPFKNYDLPGRRPVVAWNPVVMRCPGCGLDADPKYTPGSAKKHCWHLRACDMQAANQKLPAWMRDIKAGWSPARIHEEQLIAVESIKAPSIIATQFMGDVAWYTPEQMNWVAHYMRWHPQHVFLILTKWPERLPDNLPENAWAGTSASDQRTWDARVEALAGVKAAHRWVSLEPMVGAVDTRARMCLLDFVACGPETGPAPRDCSVSWMIDVARACEVAGVPFYDKRRPDDAWFLRREWPAAWLQAVA